jgi:hypothetical protein
LVAAAPLAAAAQSKVYRCGNEYTNRPAKGKDCKALDNVGVTVIHGTRPQAVAAQQPAPARTAAPRPRPAAAPATTVAAATAPRPVSIDPGQKARDSDARMILQSELQRAQARQAELVREYNNGQPDKVGGEARDYQKYVDRVAGIKASMDRNQADIDSIQRELSRVR